MIYLNLIQLYNCSVNKITSVNFTKNTFALFDMAVRIVRYFAVTLYHIDSVFLYILLVDISDESNSAVVRSIQLTRRRKRAWTIRVDRSSVR